MSADAATAAPAAARTGKATPRTKTQAKPNNRTRTKPKPKTKWGDREGRRRDILDAAREQMDTGGYLALNMRDLAHDAGVSPGTLYSYFATKEEIFATLYAEAIEEHNERIEPICRDATTLEQLLLELATAFLDLYEHYGRYFTLWSALRDEGADGDSPLPRELTMALREATLRQGELVGTSVVRCAEADGRTVPEPSLALTFLWAVLTGIGDHVTSDRRHLSSHGRRELVAYAAGAVARGITVSRR